MRSATADINPECGIEPKQSATSVSTTQRLPLNDSSKSTCRPSCAPRFGRNPNEHGSEVRLKDRLEHDLHRGLHDPVADRRNRQRPLLVGPRLRDETRRAGNGR